MQRSSVLAISDRSPACSSGSLSSGSLATSFFGEPRLADGPIEIEVLLVVERPLGHFNTKGELNKKGREMPFPHNKKPDVDNAIKLVMDALNTRAYRDDVQVCKAAVMREWGDVAHTRIRLNELNVTRES